MIIDTYIRNYTYIYIYIYIYYLFLYAFIYYFIYHINRIKQNIHLYDHMYQLFICIYIYIILYHCSCSSQFFVIQVSLNEKRHLGEVTGAEVQCDRDETELGPCVEKYHIPPTEIIIYWIWI